MTDFYLVHVSVQCHVYSGCFYFISSGCCPEISFKPVWASTHYFDDVIVHPQMLTHHLPDVVLSVLEDLDETGRLPVQVIT